MDYTTLTEQQIILLKALHVAATFQWESGNTDHFDLTWYGLKPHGFNDDITGMTWDMVYALIELGYIEDEIASYDDWGPSERYFHITDRGKRLATEIEMVELKRQRREAG